MERQRVVHFARSRTAKVIRPGFTNYPSPSQTTDVPELSQAPLASIDSDCVIITKKRDETNMAPNLWGQINTNLSQKNVILQNTGENSRILDRDELSSEQFDYSPPRTYVKLRAAQNSDLHDADENIRVTQRLHQDQYAGKRHIVSNVLSSCNKHIPTNVDNTHSRYYTQTIIRRESSYYTHTSREQQQVRERDTHMSNPLSNRATGYSSEKVHCESKSALVKDVVVGRDIKLHLSDNLPTSKVTSEYNSSKLRSSSSLPREQGDNSTYNHSNTSYFKNTKTNLHTSCKETTNFEISRRNHFVQSVVREDNKQCRENESFQMSQIGLICPTDGGDKASNSGDKDGGQMMADVCGISPSDYTSDIRLASERIAHMYTKYQPQSRPSPTSSIRASNSPFLVKDGRSVQGVNSNRWHHDVANSAHRTAPDPLSEYTPCWKRSSLKQATHGYLSISELTGSVESLDIKSSNLHQYINTRCPIGNVQEQNRNNSFSSPNSSCSTDKTHPGRLCTHNQYGSDSLGNVERVHKLDSNSSQTLNNTTELSWVKRMSFKLATTDEAYDWLNEHETCQFETLGKTPRNDINTSNNSTSGSGERYVQIDYLAGDISGMSSRKHARLSGTCANQVSRLHAADYEETLRSLKRRSFKLATSSLSDLTFLEESVDSEFSTDEHSLRNLGDGESRDFGLESFGSNDRQEVPDDSLSSGRLNSSFGSFFSCQSRDFIKSHPTMDTYPTARKPHLRSHHNQKHTMPVFGHPMYREGIASDTSWSGDSSAYYTASDSSYPTPDGECGTPPCESLLYQPPRIILPAHHQQFASHRHQKPAQKKINLQNGASFKVNTLPKNGKPPKYSNQNSMLHCYSCGMNEKFSAQNLHRERKSNTRGGFNRKRGWVNPELVPGRALENRQRSRSVPASRRPSTRQPEVVTRKLITIKSQLPTEPATTSGDITFSVNNLTASIPTNPCVDPLWQTMPRIPPSLGRPRRKLYAGFDSQPLPMDSFLSDSSSVYSTQSCSSWSTSRSATVESCTRAPDMLSKSHSTSSLASSLITPTRSVAHDDVFDFFTYSDKRSSVCENQHNLYSSRHNSYSNDCYKEVFYDKSFSKESLESFLSDGTTVNIDHDLSPGNSLGYEKTLLNSAPGSVELHNNSTNSNSKNNSNSVTILEGRRQNKQHEQLDILSKNGVLTSASFHSRNNQWKTQKGSTLEPRAKPKFLPKRKYFSSKDIFDLVMSSERTYGSSKGRSRSLEKQAQKVCETILCLT